MDEVEQIYATLAFLHEPPRLLLGMKKRRFGAGRWNGYGGKLEGGESLEDNVRREVLEESGIRVTTMEKLGFVHFDLQERPIAMNVHVFRIIGHEGEAVETEEMRPEWFDTEKLPYDRMWPTDPFWLPLFLAGKKFEAKFLMDKDDKPVSHEIKLL